MVLLRLESFAKLHRCFVGVNKNGTVSASFEQMERLHGDFCIKEGVCYRKDSLIDVTKYIVTATKEQIGVLIDSTGKIINEGM